METFISQINQYIKQVGTRNLIIAGVVVILLIIAYTIYRSLRLKVYRKQIVEIENHVTGIKTLPIQYRLGRVQSIAKNMSGVADEYEEFYKAYEDLTDFQQNDLGVLMNEVDEQLFYGKIHGVGKKMSKLETMANKYDKDSKDLLARIEKVTEIENVQRVEIIRVKEKYRGVVGTFESMRYKVEDYVPDLLDIFKSIDEDFVKLEDLMNNQKFEDAKTFTQEIEERIDLLALNLKDLPSYISVVRQLIPDKIAKVKEMIEELEEDTYALEEMNVEKRYNTIRQELEDATVLVKAVQIKQAGEILETLTDHIETLAIDLRKEKESYGVFKDKWEKCYTLVSEIYNQYKECMVDYNRILSLYIVDEAEITIADTYDDFNLLLKESYDLEEELKGGEFAYSKLLAEVESLATRVGVHSDYIKTFITQRDSLYIQEQRAIDELENINIVLLEIKSEIKNKHLPMINDSYKDYIQDSYEKAAEIQEFRQTRPVMLEDLSKKVDGARDVIYKLYDNVHNLIVTAEMVEEAIVFGNRYRSTFLEVNTELTKAEVLFRNGEYTKALSTAVDIVEKIKPGSYEELIKRQETKPA